MTKLHHGTTQQWAEEIMKNGPDPHFQVPNDPEADPQGFYTAIASGPFPFGSPKQAAHGKAKAFPKLGPPVILEIEIPDDLWPNLVGEPGEEEEGKGVDRNGEVWFGVDVWDTGIDFGTESLREAWPDLTKRILPVEGD